MVIYVEKIKFLIAFLFYSLCMLAMDDGKPPVEPARNILFEPCSDFLQDSRLLTDGKLDDAKLWAFRQVSQYSFMMGIEVAKHKLDAGYYLTAASDFISLRDLIHVELENWKKTQCPHLGIRACQAIVYSYLGIMCRKGLGHKVNNDAAKKNLVAVSHFWDKMIVEREELENPEMMTRLSPICTEAVYELAHMYEQGEVGGKEVLYKLIRNLALANKYDHPKANAKLWVAWSDEARATCTDPDLRLFIAFMEAQEKIVDPQEAYAIGRVFNASTFYWPEAAYKWLAMAAQSGSHEAKNTLAEFLEGGLSSQDSDEESGETERISATQQDEGAHSVRVINFCLWADAFVHGHELSRKDLRSYLEKSPDNHNWRKVTMGKPFSWHLKKACERVPAMSAYKFPQLSFVDQEEGRVLEIFLCCLELPTEVINLILEKVSLSLPEPPTKS